jgi:hypothetical protein
MAAAGLAATLLVVSPVRAELCFDYVDFEDTLAPFACVEQGDFSQGCTWAAGDFCPAANPCGDSAGGGDCHEDGDPGDCCTSIPVPGPMTVLTMHTAWHNCFGNIGDSDDNNPPGRGSRWYAFHRQFENDFNIWRESGHLCNPMAGDTEGCKIDSLTWCQNMIMPYGHLGCNLDPGDHPAGCGTTGNRPSGRRCPQCVTFPQCLFVSGGGPLETADPLDDCSVTEICSSPGGEVSFPYASLDEFPNVEEIATMLDGWFHGPGMHTAVGAADGAYCQDVTMPACSPRDPMFWRLHKALDDVVRAWQDINAVDVMVVVDRSGSMNAADVTGVSKLDASLEALDMFADLLEEGRSDGQTNRLGIVSYATNAADAARNLPLTDVDATLRDPAGPYDTAVDAIDAAGGGGCTAIGLGIEGALAQLCPPLGDCQGFSAAGDNDRKAILLLTDGLENIPPCLQSMGAAPSFCGGVCSGAQLDFERLDVTQLCSVGFGTSGSLNGELLTLVSERQGGIYMQNPGPDADGEWIDLKDFFAKCFGRLTDEFVGLDPKGVLGATVPVSEPIPYSSCGDDKITFAAGWKEPAPPGSLRLMVTTPSGELVRDTMPGVESSLQPTWNFVRMRPSLLGESPGTWTGHLIRPHRAYVNGFTTDSFADMDKGVALVRREIQRLCPTGCARVLYFEDGLRGLRSAYKEAVAFEMKSRLLGSVTTATSALELAQMLDAQWDLIVYAHQMSDQAEPYDSLLASRICQGLPAIVTDTRTAPADPILSCAGAARFGLDNFTNVTGDGRLLEGTLSLVNPGYPVFSYGIVPRDLRSSAVQAFNELRGVAITARFEPGVEHKWFVDVLVRGLSRLQVSNPRIFHGTGEDLFASISVLPSFIRSGGYDSVVAQVEVTRPTQGLGTFLTNVGLQDEREIGGEILSRRASTLLAIEEAKPGPLFGTTTEVYRLYDDGTHGDVDADNGTWTVQIPVGGQVDGTYQFHFIVDFDAGGCATRRESFQSLFVEVKVDPGSSPTSVGTPTTLPDGRTSVGVTVKPQDRLGNFWGPGRVGMISCGPRSACDCDGGQVVDHGDGSYTIPVVVAAGLPLSICTINGFGTTLTTPSAEVCGGATAGEPGTRVTIPIAVNEGAGVAGFQVDVSFDPSALSVAGVRLGADTAAAGGWTIDQALIGPGSLRLLGQSNPPTGLAAGTRELALVDFDVAAAAPIGPSAVTQSNCVLSDARGVAIPCSLCPQGGTVLIRNASAYRFRPIGAYVGIDAFDPLPFEVAIEAVDDFGNVATGYDRTANVQVAGALCPDTLRPDSMAFTAGLGGPDTFRIECCPSPVAATAFPLSLLASDPPIAVSGESDPFTAVAKADLDASGDVSVVDVTRAVRLSLLQSVPQPLPTTMQTWAGNMPDPGCAVDGFINILDVVRIRNKAIGRPPLCPCPGTPAGAGLSLVATSAPLGVDLVREGPRSHLLQVRGARDLGGLQLDLKGAGPDTRLTLEGAAASQGWQLSTEAIRANRVRVVILGDAFGGLSGDGAVLRITGPGHPRLTAVVASDSDGREIPVQ